eukprot:532300-Ditylum_brightwellii.AAC.1
MPTTSSADAAAVAALDLIEALKNPHLPTPFPGIGNKQMDALQALADIFHIALAPPKEVPKPVPLPPGRALMAPLILPTAPSWLPTVPAPQATPIGQPLQVPTPPPRVP